MRLRDVPAALAAGVLLPLLASGFGCPSLDPRRICPPSDPNPRELSRGFYAVRSSAQPGYPGSKPGYAGTYDGDTVSISIAATLTGHVAFTEERSETLRLQLAETMMVSYHSVTAWRVKQTLATAEQRSTVATNQSTTIGNRHDVQYAWAISAMVVASVSAEGFASPDEFRDSVHTNLKEARPVLAQDLPLSLDVASVRTDIARRHVTDVDAVVRYHDVTPVSVSFNITASVPTISDGALSGAQRTALKRLVKTTLNGIGNSSSAGGGGPGDDEEDDGLDSLLNFGVASSLRKRRHESAAARAGLDPRASASREKWSVDVVWAVKFDVAVNWAARGFPSAEGWATAIHTAIANTPEFQLGVVAALDLGPTWRPKSSAAFRSGTYDVLVVKSSARATVVARPPRHNAWDDEVSNDDFAAGFTHQRPCERGFYCVEGERRPCPAGRYGAAERETSPTCTGPATAGFYTPPGSQRPTERVCGNVSFFCPAGSGAPTRASEGFYTYGDAAFKRGLRPFASVDADSDGRLSWAEFSRDGGLGAMGTAEVDAFGELRVLWRAADEDTSNHLDRREYARLVDALDPMGSVADSLELYNVPKSHHVPVQLPMNMTRYGDRHFALSSTDTRVGQLPCEEGFYCVGGVRFRCPRGVYGAARGLSSPSCSGPSAPGYYAPEQSTSRYGESTTTSPVRGPMPCGNDTVFCPTGSHWPQPVFRGHYTLGGLVDGTTRSFEERCPPGSWCREGKRGPCAAGHFGDAWGLEDPKCSGLCRAGFHCPIGSSKAEEWPCGDPSQYCPEGSAFPVYAADGFFTVNGVCTDVWPTELAHFTQFDNFQRKMEPVFTNEQLTDLAHHEHWVPRQTWTLQVTATSTCRHALRFGFAYGGGSLIATIPGNATDVTVRVVDDLRVAMDPSLTYLASFDSCDAMEVTSTVDGRTYDTTIEPMVKFHEIRIGLGVCTGFADAEQGTCLETRWSENVIFDDVALVGTSWSNSRNTTLEYVARSIHTDPPPPPLRTDLGFKKPSSLATGRFTPVPADWLRGRRWEPCVFDEPTADGVAIERRLVYDDGPVAVWVRGEPVWWRNVEEVGTMPTLTYSIYKARFEVNMPEGTTQRTTQAKAPRGHYAIRGLLYECPAGRFGASKGMSHADCSGECQKGYYCPPASVHPRQRICGGPERFCPPGSAFPLLVTTGYYSSTTVDECPPGQWRNTSGVRDPSRYPNTNQQSQKKTASTVPTVVHLASHGGDGPGDGFALGPLAPCVACPWGKFKAITGDSVDLCVDCDSTVSVSSEDRTYCECQRSPNGATWEALNFIAATGSCVAVDAENHSTFVRSNTLTNSTYTRFKQMQCPRGHFCPTVESGQYSLGVRTVCPAGRYGGSLRETSPNCTGVCEKGYYCPEGSSTATQFPCGGADRFCPTGSSTPILVRVGWYTNEDRHEDIRTSEAICPVGHWCSGGIRHTCAPGLWGGKEGMSSRQCSGKCSPGYYCPEASTSPKQVPCGGAGVFCPEGSSEPTPVTIGFYSTHTGAYEDELQLNDPLNETMSAQLVCPPGYWCKGGKRFHCPAGTFGWTWGLTHEACSGSCKSGYYCPSHPGPPSIRATQAECGVEADGTPRPDPSAVYCPSGSGNTITRVSPGYYTIGGKSDNRTRTGQVRCESGYFCKAGIKQPCPGGTFNSKMKQSKCVSICPAGFACPEASVEPTPCTPGSYSTGGAVACTLCPGETGGREGRQSCTNARSCCSF